MKLKHIIQILILNLLVFSSAAFAQEDIRESLFKETSARLDAARKENVNLMSPSFFKDALASFKGAEDDFNKGASLNDIKEQIAEVNASLSKALKTAEVGKVTFADAISARADAIEVSSDLNVPE